MHVGFTGTRHGMTHDQAVAVHSLLVSRGATCLHHGDCLGADLQAHMMALALELDTVLHPPSDSKYRAFCRALTEHDHEPAPYIYRNHRIVDASVEVYAAPRQSHEVLRSGTWATIRYAIGLNIPTMIVFPDGSMEDHTAMTPWSS